MTTTGVGVVPIVEVACWEDSAMERRVVDAGGSTADGDDADWDGTASAVSFRAGGVVLVVANTTTARYSVNKMALGLPNRDWILVLHH
mmetsp:Transcript_14076/g.33737  ORF Transcript_14076/g.33737 Transcript_14076/m.33737 type:complete len:88 (+) Transcript_14076:215-478(+)